MQNAILTIHLYNMLNSYFVFDILNTDMAEYWLAEYQS